MWGGRHRLSGVQKLHEQTSWWRIHADDADFLRARHRPCLFSCLLLYGVVWEFLVLPGGGMRSLRQAQGQALRRQTAAPQDDVAAYNTLMGSDEISERAKGEIRELKNKAVKSAIAMLKDIPRLFDLIYTEFPEAYNEASPGFGRVSSVRIWEPTKAESSDPKYLSHAAHTKFYRHECKYDFPDGFIMPLVWALGELMEYKDGKGQLETRPIPLHQEESGQNTQGVLWHDSDGQL